jgi:hypothetical protein
MFVAVRLNVYVVSGWRYWRSTKRDSFVLLKFGSKSGVILSSLVENELQLSDVHGALPRPERSEASIDMDAHLLMVVGARSTTRGVIGEKGNPIGSDDTGEVA